MTPEAYVATIEPMLAPARRMHAEVRPCGAMCARPSAYTIVTLEGYRQQLLTEQAASRFADGILKNVDRIRAYYEFGNGKP